MKYDTIIIGGGLSGLMAGVKLARSGCKVAIISSGQSALHFHSGSFGLLGHADGKELLHPLEAIGTLPAGHPYSKIGAESIPALADDAKQIFADAGLTFIGDSSKNHFRLTPLGLCEPSWLTMDDYATCENPSETGWRKATIINFKGFLDFLPGFLADGLKKHNLPCDYAEITLPAIERLRRNSSEMRAAAIAKVLKGPVLEMLASEINRAAGNSDVVFMPAVVGIDSEQPVRELRSMVIPKLLCVPVLPMSVCGMRSQIRLRRYFEQLGGTYFLGDNVTRGYMEGPALKEIETANLSGMSLQADNFILATGSFFNQGLVAEPDRIYEPVLGADVEAPSDRSLWCGKSIFDNQPYMQFGVTTDRDFHVMFNGIPAGNVYAVGAILGGSNPIREGSGGGVAILSALQVARNIIAAGRADNSEAQA